MITAYGPHHTRQRHAVNTTWCMRHYTYPPTTNHIDSICSAEKGGFTSSHRSRNGQHNLPAKSHLSREMAANACPGPSQITKHSRNATQKTNTIRTKQTYRLTSHDTSTIETTQRKRYRYIISIIYIVTRVCKHGNLSTTLTGASAERTTHRKSKHNVSW